MTLYLEIKLNDDSMHPENMNQDNLIILRWSEINEKKGKYRNLRSETLTDARTVTRT